MGLDAYHHCVNSIRRDNVCADNMHIPDTIIGNNNNARRNSSSISDKMTLKLLQGDQCIDS